MNPYVRFAAPAALSALLTACVATYTQQPGGGFGPPAVELATPGGAYPLYVPPNGPSASGVLTAPPGYYASNPASLPPPGGGSNDGTYDGTATLLQNDYGDCAFHFAMTNMHVVQGNVRFARFHGRIGPDGGVRMADGSTNWITGHFAEGHFSGAYANRYCTYTLSLDRVAG